MLSLKNTDKFLDESCFERFCALHNNNIKTLYFCQHIIDSLVSLLRDNHVIVLLMGHLAKTKQTQQQKNGIKHPRYSMFLWRLFLFFGTFIVSIKKGINVCCCYCAFWSEVALELLRCKQWFGFATSFVNDIRA